jgi:hypothetical protein
MQVSPSAYYAWLKRPAKLITGEELHLHRRAKALFKKLLANADDMLTLPPTIIMYCRNV